MAEQPSTLATLLRLRTWTRPHRAAMWSMLAAASGAMLAQAVVPIVIGRVIDGPIRHHDVAGLWALSGLAMALGFAEAALFFARRRAMAVAALGVETDLRRDLFAHVQRLPVSFHDRWPSGQLLSRLTTDLSTLRRFIGLAAVFLLASTLTIVVVVALLISIQIWLGLIVLVSMIPLLISTRRFELRYSQDARRAQDLTGDLATSVEESALGIRVIKSFGRRAHMLERFRADARRLQGAELTKIRTLGLFWALLEGLPQVVLAIVTAGGVYATAHGAISVGELVAFVALYLQLVWP
ncbi:MAG: ATP-binding cassette, subfamily bacterial, partial [Pseudonocardiales bacterium]|nr:ATP-binding cassette, subfamily bacterial [Pseudonocardiales bacterium]